MQSQYSCHPKVVFDTSHQRRNGALQIAQTGFLSYQLVSMASKSLSQPQISICKKGTITYRFGKPYHPKIDDLPSDFTAFHPEYERSQKHILERETQVAMEKINDLLDPDCQWDQNPEGDGFKGNDRFL